MAVRETCLDLIHRLRRYAGDPYSHTQFFSDDDLQEILDRHRIPWQQLELVFKYTIAANGTYIYTDYYARGESGEVEVGDWEKGYLLQGPDWATVTPATADENTGHWAFAAPAGQLPPVRITGYSYDLAGAAAECWDARAAALFCKMDVSDSGTNVRASQLYDHACNEAEKWRMQMQPSIAQMVRTDLLQDWSPGRAVR